MSSGKFERPKADRCIALIGPYLSGKTTLLESILARTGAITRQGTIGLGNTLGDASPEARSHNMGVELNIASTTYRDETYTFIDCPGSIELSQEMNGVLPIIDAAIVVCEPDEKKLPSLQLILHKLDELNIPHFLFINKIDKSQIRVRELVSMLQPLSTRPLVLRQLPIWENELVTGIVDLALKRAFVYREHKSSEVVDLPDHMSGGEEEARFEMLEKLADYDDDLMEALLEDIDPPEEQVFSDLSKEFSGGSICSVLIGSAEHGNGIRRLMKALRHEVVPLSCVCDRLGIPTPGQDVIAQTIKTFHTPHGGKLSVVRLLSGGIKDGDILYGATGHTARIAGLFSLQGQTPHKTDRAEAGDLVALGRLETVKTGETLSTIEGPCEQLCSLETSVPVYGLAVRVKEHKDEVRLTEALLKVQEEDPSLMVETCQDTNQIIVWGQGEMHLRISLSRLLGKYGIEVEAEQRRVAYKETIRGHAQARGKYKKQSGGHGQYGDVTIEVSPCERGVGFQFTEKITGGAVPKQYIPAVEAGIREYLQKGYLGFPVVDLAVKLVDGSYHSVDSSEQAFKVAGRLAMLEAHEACNPVLLEPIMLVKIFAPSSATAQINQIVSSHRGQILGFDARPDWPGWDMVSVYMPDSELQNLIIELRSASAGVGSFTSEFDHLKEVTKSTADQILQSYKEAAA